jgi:intein/homing endonuclease
MEIKLTRDGNLITDKSIEIGAYHILKPDEKVIVVPPSDSTPDAVDYMEDLLEDFTTDDDVRFLLLTSGTKLYVIEKEDD